jgi:UDP-N-acetylmuramoyl-L-alanyl-D-glutamate--2,6-diaminopimelate ligase
MKLAKLVYDALGVRLSLPDTEVLRVVQDSRRLEPGVPAVFVARRGGALDGHRFAAQAVAQGAVAVVGEALPEEQRQFPWYGLVPYIYVPDDKAALARLAATLYQHPSRKLFCLGVTGTDGKTTTSYLLHYLLSPSFPTGLLSTAGVRIGGEAVTLPGHFTTPEAPEVQELLVRCVAAGCTHAVIESSSHGLAQRRLDEVDYDVGVWTNLSPEHLDFHGTLKAYRDAKAELMARAPVSVLNLDDREYGYFASKAPRHISYGLAEGAAWRAVDVRETPGTLSWTLERRGARVPAVLPMVGRYNVLNALAALGAASEAGIALEVLLGRLATFPGVPGRMQVVQGEPFAVVVDFAHTPAALTKALEALRPQAAGRLVVVVGAAGERDPGKRAPLGESAAQHADLAVFTEEDSRSEDVAVILEAMAGGAEGAGSVRDETFWLVPDRREAIRRALELAEPGDLVLLAGKGHETTLERRSQTLPWDEVAEVRAALESGGE